ncbi:hypothetical protein K8R32_00540 [bacterium]|nr:hypothetical protein [bacterium]
MPFIGALFSVFSVILFISIFYLLVIGHFISIYVLISICLCMISYKIAKQILEKNSEYFDISSEEDHYPKRIDIKILLYLGNIVSILIASVLLGFYWVMLYDRLYDEII